jgi:WW domain
VPLQPLLSVLLSSMIPSILQVYYYNTVTGDSSWSTPEDFAGNAPTGSGGGASVPISTTPVKGTSWSEILCSDGKTYYHNSATQVSVWAPHAGHHVLVA